MHNSLACPENKDFLSTTRKIFFFEYKLIEVYMGIHFNHKSKAGDRKMQKELKLKMKSEERKKKREEKERLEQEEEMRKLEELTRPDKTSVK